MTKFALAVIAALSLTTFSSVPASAQNCNRLVACAPSSNPTPSLPTTDSCGSELGYLKRVDSAEIRGIKQGTRVWVTEICDSFAALRSEGNAEYLRPSIAKNKVLTSALFSKDYSAEDVFAVRMMGDDTVNLYVHHFGR